MRRQVKQWKAIVIFIELPALLFLACSADQVTWTQDIASDVRIGVPSGGYSRAVLDCEADNMAFIITLEQEFEGILYTRGSFHKKEGPCYLNAKGGKEFALKFAYNDCGTKYDEKMGGYTTTVVVQHDDDLIFPGDHAFSLLCRDTRTADVSLDGEKSRISVVDPDPSPKASVEPMHHASSTTSVVTLTPAKFTSKQEL